MGLLSSLGRPAGRRVAVVAIPDSVHPRCPHCEASLGTVAVRQLDIPLGVATMYCCPECLTSLGVSHRKGFWMG